MKSVLSILASAGVCILALSASASETERKLSDSELSVMGIIVGKSTLLDVQRKYTGEVTRSGRGDGYAARLCYIGDDGTVVTFKSAAMGNAGETVDQVEVAAAGLADSKICIKSSSVNQKLQVFGVRLGETRMSLKFDKGQPAKENRNLAIYSYISYHETRMGEAINISTLQVSFAGVQVGKVSISNVDAY